MAGATRHKFKVLAGERATHRVPCRWQDGDDGTECQLGALEWSIVVLDELTVGLEVRAEISAPDGSTSVRFVQENGASAQKFQGTFNPAERFAEAFEENRLDAIVFELDNTFSWWNAKDVEIVTICEPADQHRPPPRLRLVPTVTLPPRPAAKVIASPSCVLPELLRLPDVAKDAPSILGKQVLAAFEAMAVLDVELAHCPRHPPGLDSKLQALQAHLQELQSTCVEIRRATDVTSSRSKVQ
mmetsp:Transcript_1848/g.4670  ORF Transcript_1848/g.4670 Transcript_1848/m.4670 type:complete len:242 (-) Transcript_1848:102-827(-)